MPITDHEVITVLVLEDLKPLDSDLPLTSVLVSPDLLSETQKKCSKNFSGAILWLISWMISLGMIRFLEVYTNFPIELIFNFPNSHVRVFLSGSRNRSNNRGQRPSVSGGVSRQPNNSLASPFFSPMGFGLGGPMGLSNFFSMHDNMGSGIGGSEFFSTTTFGVGAGGQAVPAVKRTSTSTRVSNGKKIVTKKSVHYFFNHFFFIWDTNVYCITF